MNLLTFAVRQKLVHDDALLPYVVQHQDVPIHVLEESFRELLADLVDVKASQLIDDPDTLLGTEVPVLIKRDSEGGYEIEGDIPDTLMEAIQLVHNKTQDAVVKSLVNYNMGMLYGQHCDVVSVELLQDKAKQTVTSLQDMPSVKPLPEVLADTSVIEDIVIDLPEDEIEPIPPIDLPEGVLHDEELPEGILTMESDAPEEERGEPVEDEGEDFRASVRRIYMKLVNDIKSFGLDKRLSLTI